MRSKELLVALGVNGDGYGEILGFRAADTESEGSWGDFFSSLKALVRAIGKHFQGAAWQRCQTHFSRNLLDVCPKKHQPTIKAHLKSLYESVDHEAARAVKERILTEYGQNAPKVCALLEEAFDDVKQVLRLPMAIRRRLAHLQRDRAGQRGNPAKRAGDPDLPERGLATPPDRGAPNRHPRRGAGRAPVPVPSAGGLCPTCSCCWLYQHKCCLRYQCRFYTQIWT
ncbi:hypothetical protein ABB02_00547 [Clostridiaceae bacterium JG1575]|nr:hypothetical protein ABB02_00547 [Clostridiaceae bacterium JG1575]